MSVGVFSVLDALLYELMFVTYTWRNIHEAAARLLYEYCSYEDFVDSFSCLL